LINAISKNDDITINDLYERYPDFNIDIAYEQELLLAHDVIVWQHPIYWFSCPPLMKQWLDLVLSFGWAYGKVNKALKGKFVFSAISTGGSANSYTTDGRNGHVITDYLLPFSQTAKFCDITYLPPFVIHGTHLLSNLEISKIALDYKNLLEKIMADKDDLLHLKCENLNQIIENK
jgi:glutathione-regulated potassium-efflux system ancillary protein KefG